MCKVESSKTEREDDQYIFVLHRILSGAGKEQLRKDEIALLAKYIGPDWKHKMFRKTAYEEDHV